MATLERIKTTPTIGWREVTLAECAEFSDSTYSPKEAWPVINYLDTGSISENRISEIQVLESGRDKIPSRARRKVQPGDILYSTVRPNQKHFGLLKYVPENFLASTGFAVFRGKADIADTSFLYWFLAQDQIVNYLHSIAENSTSAYPSIRPSDLGQLTLLLPPLSEQRAIAQVLGTLDDKIELNRRMNETLEAMARALFKSWFVDFEPVRAKMEDRWQRGESFLGLPADHYDIFPDRFVDSELGKTPEGWEVGTIGNIVSRKNERVGGRSAIVLSAISRGELTPSDSHFSKRVYSRGISNYLAVRQWDTAYNPSRINIGSIGMLKEPILGAVSPVYVVASPKPAYRWYLEFALRLDQTKEWIATLSTGSVRQSLSYTDFASIPCIIPPSHVVERFNQQWERFRAILLAHDTETYILTAQRNTLLPKLVSGAVRVGRLVRIPNGEAL